METIMAIKQTVKPKENEAPNAAPAKEAEAVTKTLITKPDNAGAEAEKGVEIKADTAKPDNSGTADTHKQDELKQDTGTIVADEGTKVDLVDAADTAENTGAETVLDDLVEKAPEQRFVKLAKLSTYVHSDGKTYQAPHVYTVTPAQADDLLTQASPFGVPYFNEVDDPDAALQESKLAKTTGEAIRIQPDAVVTESPAARPRRVDTTSGDNENDIGAGITITHSEPVNKAQPASATNRGNSVNDADIDTGAMRLKDASGKEVGVKI